MTNTRWAWLVLALILLPFAIFEAVKYGTVATIVLVTFVILPDVSLIGAFADGVKGMRLKPARVRFYNFMHSVWIPLGLMAAAVVVPLPSLGLGLRPGLELFLAGLAWLLHVAADRAAGFDLREPDGSIRAPRPTRTAR